MESIIHHWSQFIEPEFLSRNLNYLLILVFVYSFLEVVFPPIPGDTLMVLSGSLAGFAKISPIWLIGCASVGTLCASLLIFNLGYKMEHRILKSPRFSWMLDSKTFVKLEKWFLKYGLAILLVSRFLPVARSGIVLAAGIVNLDRIKSMVAVGISAFVSATFFILLGSYLGSRWQDIFKFWQAWSHPILLSLAGLGFAFLIYRVIQKGLRKNSKMEAN